MERSYIDDLTELLKRIFEYDMAYKSCGIKTPLFRLTPYEHRIFVAYLRSSLNFEYEAIGLLPTFMGVDFELVGAPVLFGGKHIRSDSGIEFVRVNKDEF